MAEEIADWQKEVPLEDIMSMDQPLIVNEQEPEVAVEAAP